METHLLADLALKTSVSINFVQIELALFLSSRTRGSSYTVLRVDVSQTAQPHQQFIKTVRPLHLILDMPAPRDGLVWERGRVVGLTLAMVCALCRRWVAE